MQEIDWMADHDLNTVILFVRPEMFKYALMKIPDMQPYLSWLQGKGTNTLESGPVVPGSVERLNAITVYCHTRGIKVVYVLGIDVNDDLCEKFPNLAATRSNSTNILCPSNPEVRMIFRNVWEVVIAQLPDADGYAIMPPDSGGEPCTCNVCSQSNPAHVLGSQVRELYDIMKVHEPKALFVTWPGYGYMEKYAQEYADAFPKDVIIEVHRYDLFDYNQLKKVLDIWSATGHPIWFKMALYRFAWMQEGKLQPVPIRVLGKKNIGTVISAVKDSHAEGMFGFCANTWTPALQNIEDFDSLLHTTRETQKH